MQTFMWLKGTWEMPTKSGKIYEIWKVESKNVLVGESYRTSNGEKIPLEEIKLKWENGEFWYVPAVSQQNDGNAISFKLKSTINGNKFTFVNQEHDFPQQITYELKPMHNYKHSIGDTLMAKIEGEARGQYRSRTFIFLRVK
jgi:hypothetical protein